MDVSNRIWWVKIDDQEFGPIAEDEFQNRLRSGEFSLKAELKNNFSNRWDPLLRVISNDPSFRRVSTIPPPNPDRKNSNGLE